MKLKLTEIIEAHTALKGSTINTLEVAEQKQVFRLNSAIYSVVKEFNEMREDIIDRLRPANQEELRDLQGKITAKTATPEEQAKYLVATHAHQAVIEEHLRPILREEREVKAEPIAMDVWEKIAKENKWPMGSMNAIESFAKME